MAFCLYKSLLGASSLIYLSMVYVPSTVLIKTSYQPCGIRNNTVIPIMQMRDLRHGKVKEHSLSEEELVFIPWQLAPESILSTAADTSRAATLP